MIDDTIVSWLLNFRIRMFVKSTVKGLCQAIYYLLKNLKLFSYQLNSKKNCPVLLFKIVFRH